MPCSELEDKITYEIETNASGAGVNTKKKVFLLPHRVQQTAQPLMCTHAHPYADILKHPLLSSFTHTPNVSYPQKQTHESHKTHTTQPYMCYQRTRIMYRLTHVISRMRTIHLVQ